MSRIIDQIKETKAYIATQTNLQPEIGIVLGSGLGNLTSEIEIEKEIAYADLPNFPATTVKGHSGKLIFGKLSGKKIIALSGRFHFYEGYTMEQVVFPIRLMKFLGCHSVIISNASGSVNPTHKIGDLMVITDHINLQPIHPLNGPNDENLGPRFPSMMEPYKKAYIDFAMEIVEQHNLPCHKGVYVGVQGPTFETPAEYKAFHILGGDVVGMSTVPEVIAAKHVGLDVFGISVVSDCGYPPDESISHDMVVEAAKNAEPKMTLIIKELLKKL